MGSGEDHVRRFERKCVVCGAVFPAGTPAAKKYCPECLEVRQGEAKIRHRNKEREKARERAKADAEAEKSRLARMEQAKNNAYCEKCIYHGFIRDGGMTCDYIVITGHMRRCKGGYGCEKRELEPTSQGDLVDRVCERCGAPYVGTRSSHFCSECRRASSRENAKKAHEAYMAKLEESK